VAVAAVTSRPLAKREKLAKEKTPRKAVERTQWAIWTISVVSRGIDNNEAIPVVRDYAN
jgi:hypothetical protein